MHEIFFWFVCTGNERLARMLWPFCDLPLHVVLLGSLISRKMSTSVVRGRDELAARADRMLQWACGAIGMAAEETQAHSILKMNLCGKYSAIDIAMHMGGKSFLSQPHCRSLIDKWKKAVKEEEAIAKK